MRSVAMLVATSDYNIKALRKIRNVLKLINFSTSMVLFL